VTQRDVGDRYLFAIFTPRTVAAIPLEGIYIWSRFLKDSIIEQFSAQPAESPGIWASCREKYDR